MLKLTYFSCQYTTFIIYILIVTRNILQLKNRFVHRQIYQLIILEIPDIPDADIPNADRLLSGKVIGWGSVDECYQTKINIQKCA